MKKIICTVTNDLSYDQRMQRISSTLAEVGYDVLLVGRERRASVPLQQQPFRQHRLKCFFEKGKMFYAEYNIRLFFYLLSKPVEIVCAVDADTIMAAFSAAQLRGAKRVFDAHEYFTEVPELQGRKWVKKVWRWIEKIFIPKAHLAYTVSESIAEIHGKKHQKRFYAIRNVPELTNDPQEKTSTQNEKYILYQGALNAGRGLEQLILAMNDVPQKLYLAGEGDLSKQLRELVKEQQLTDRVIFLGFLQPSELKSWTQRAYIGINLLENTSLSYYYSLANKFFDYMHAGVPQLCMDFPEYKRINDKTAVALLLPNLDRELIVNNLNHLFFNNELYLSLQKNCSIAREQYNWQYESEQLISLYSKLV